MELHPLCTLFPRMAGAELEALKADIIANGQREPIVLHEGKVLDGGNRYFACVEAGIEPKTVAFCGGDPISFVLSANFHRRHLSAGQQAAVVAAAQDWAQARQIGGDQRSKVQPLHLDTAADRAKAANASLRTQRMADKVAKADPELAKRVAHGEISLPKAVAQITPPKAHPTDTPTGMEDYDLAADTPTLEEMLETERRENASLFARIEALSQNDTAAELDKQIRIRQGIEQRMAQEMSRANEFDKQLKRMGKVLADLRRLLGVEDNSQILAAVKRHIQQAA